MNLKICFTPFNRFFSHQLIISQCVIQEKILQQGEYESLYRDIIAGYANWEFDPADVQNPFPNNEGSVHIWQGLEDKIIPYSLNRYLSQKLPWIRYHEVPDGGHLLAFERNFCEAIIRDLLLN